MSTPPSSSPSEASDPYTLEYNTDIGLDFEWQFLYGCITKAPLGGDQTGPNPPDRGKKGTKRHLLTEATGMPIGLVVTGANRHDKTQVEAVFESMPLPPPLPTEEHPQHFCADKGYDYPDVRSLIGFMEMIEPIKSRGEGSSSLRLPGYRARWWVCEPTHMDEPISTLAYPVGEETRQLSRLRSFGLCIHHLTPVPGFRIGTKLDFGSMSHKQSRSGAGGIGTWVFSWSRLPTPT